MCFQHCVNSLNENNLTEDEVCDHDMKILIWILIMFVLLMVIFCRTNDFGAPGLTGAMGPSHQLRSWTH